MAVPPVMHAKVEEPLETQLCYTPENGWRRTITYWCVIRTFEGVGYPACLEGRPDLQAIFVMNISGVVGFESLGRACSKAADHLREVEDQLYRKACGPEYGSLMDEYENTLKEHEEAYRQTYYQNRADDMVEVSRATARHADLRFYEGLIHKVHELDRKAKALAGKAAQLRTEEVSRKVKAHVFEASREYWAENSIFRLRNDFFSEIFADNPYYPESRILRIDDRWWVRFKKRLQAELLRRNPVEWFLLEDLPGLRAAVSGGTKLATLVEEWRAEKAPLYGLPASAISYAMIEKRANKKAREVEAWFDTHPWGTADLINEIGAAEARIQANDALERHLAEHDSIPYTGYSLRPDFSPEGWHPISKAALSR